MKRSGMWRGNMPKYRRLAPLGPFYGGSLTHSPFKRLKRLKSSAFKSRLKWRGAGKFANEGGKGRKGEKGKGGLKGGLRDEGV